MAYSFPYEDIFLYMIVVIIVGLLFMRVRLARKRREQAMTQSNETQE